jgi:hypothetical protein
MKQPIEMGSDAMTYIPVLIKIGSCFQKLMGWGIHGHTEWRSHKRTFIFSK